MVAPFINIDGLGKVADIIDSVADQIVDFRPLFFLLANDFYKDEKRIFKLKGKGRFDDLSEEYKDQKARLHGFVYPILKASGKLEKSLTNPSSPEAIHQFKAGSMVIGSKNPTAFWHHGGTRKMPVRPIWEINKGSRLGGRWVDTADAYFEKVLGRAAKNARRKKRNF